ncbi:hypothetical protein D9758_006316 [Tetrapyrgos nigripes]|uniref:Glycoside hydrolase family 71 protein n=1 Tax=Tetrapyrgos nigripes TaxID=182062 RepID=A0A8H5G0E0_9AGAR|nr:hypothetical protein D9758_006316 [Tetrapyrgos nigripes]
MSPLVFAHFMVGNTYPYSIKDWAEDIDLALKSNLDGFVLNVGKERWQLDRVSDCFEAASRAGCNIKFFLSFDMSSIPAKTESDIQLLAGYLEKFANSDKMLHISDKVVVSTFAGENSLFGQSSLDSAWLWVKRVLRDTVGIEIHYLPSLFIDPEQYTQLSCLDGVFHWNGAWPVHLGSGSSPGEKVFPKLDSDLKHISHLNGRPYTYMASVSPWFFTHYGADSWNKNWIYRGDDWLLVKRWEFLIENRHKIDIVQVISWNDYGESHYIGPVKGAQPNSEAWVNGFPHEAWLHLNSHYIRAFKEGTRHPIIEKDMIFMWARPHPRDAQALEDPLPRPNNWQLADDDLRVVILAKDHAGVVVTAGDTDKQFRIYKGVNLLSMPLQTGGGMSAKMYRETVLVAECSASGYRFEANPKTYNFNAFTAMSA